MSLWKQILTASIYQVYILIFIFSYSDTPPIRQKALESRLFKMALVQRFLGFREQSYTLHMMRLRK